MKEKTEKEYQEYFSDKNLKNTLDRFQPLRELLKKEFKYIFDEENNLIAIEDSFIPTFLTYKCDKDMTWETGLDDNFYAGLELGMMNTFKVLKENPELLQKL